MSSIYDKIKRQAELPIENATVWLRGVRLENRRLAEPVFEEISSCGPNGESTSDFYFPVSDVTAKNVMVEGVVDFDCKADQPIYDDIVCLSSRELRIFVLDEICLRESRDAKKTPKKKQKNENKSYWTPPELAGLWGVSADKVRRWIDRGELAAINVSDGGKRSFRRISEEARLEFEQRNLVTGSTQKRKKKPTNKPMEIKEWVK